VRRSSKLFGLLLAAAFLAALAWALSAQSDLWRTHARPLRPKPGPALPGEEAPAPPENATGVVGTVEEDTAKALEKSLRAERDARKRLDAPPPAGKQK
jgi:hypothetical protein